MATVPTTSQTTPHTPTHASPAANALSTTTSSASTMHDTAVVAGTPTTTLRIILIGRNICQGLAAGFQSIYSLSVNFNASSVDVTNAGASTTSLATVATAATDSPDANAASLPASSRCVRGGGTRPSAVMAIMGLLFLPTLALMLGATLMSRDTIGSAPIFITNMTSLSVFFITLIFELAAATVEALSTGFPTLPDAEPHDASSANNWSERLKLIARCLAVVAIILFLIGVGSLASEYSSLGVGSVAEVSPLIK